MAFFVSALLLFADGGAWTTVLKEDGYTVERRDLAADRLEVRTSTHTRCAPKKVFDVIWKQEDYDQFVPYTKKNKILKDEANARLVYSQLALPIIKDRDFTVRMRKEHDAGSGLYLIYLDGADREGPPESQEYVRIRYTKASWTLEPTQEGGSDVTYVVATETGGIVPRWIQESAQKSAARNFVAAMLKRSACN